MRYLIAVFLGLLLPLGAVAAATAVEEKRILELYRRGLSGDKGAVEACIEKLEGVLAEDRHNQLARVYLGSAYTLRSRDMGFGPKKLQVLKQGVALMDEAVAAAPDDPKVRLARALTTSALPGILGYGASSRKDFEQLAAAAQHSPGKFERGDLQIIFYNAGLAARKAGNRARAVELWQEALRYPVDENLKQKTEAAIAGDRRPIS